MLTCSSTRLHKMSAENLTDREIYKAAEFLKCRDYLAIAIKHLKLTFVQADNLLYQYRENNQQALREALTRWRNRTYGQNQRERFIKKLKDMYDDNIIQNPQDFDFLLKKNKDNVSPTETAIVKLTDDVLFRAAEILAEGDNFEKVTESLDLARDDACLILGKSCGNKRNAIFHSLIHWKKMCYFTYDETETAERLYVILCKLMKDLKLCQNKMDSVFLKEVDF